MMLTLLQGYFQAQHNVVSQTLIKETKQFIHYSLYTKGMFQHNNRKL